MQTPPSDLEGNSVPPTELELDELNRAPIQGGDRAPQHAIEQGESDPDDLIPPWIEALMQTPPWMEALMQTPPWMDALVQRPPGMDALVQRPPGMDAHALVQRPPGMDALVRRPPWMDAWVQRPPGMDALVQRPPGRTPPGMDALVLQLEREREESNLERGRVNGVEQNDSTQRSFMAYVAQSLLNLSTKQLNSFLGTFSVGLGSLTAHSTTRFDPLQVIKTRYTAEEAFRAYYPEVIHMTMFMIFFTIIFIMVLPLPLRYQVFMGVLLTFSTVFYLAILGLNASASGVYVACGGLFELPLFSFVSLEAAGFSVIIGLVIFLICYLGWRFVHKGNPRAVEGSLDGLLPL